MIGRLLAVIIVGYQRFVSPLLMPRCRYAPSCSEYAVVALRERGAVRGIGLAAWRVLRCNPFSAGGYDPVPHPHVRQHHAAPGASNHSQGVHQ